MCCDTRELPDFQRNFRAHTTASINDSSSAELDEVNEVYENPTPLIGFSRSFRVAQTKRLDDDALATVLVDAAKELPVRARRILAAHPGAVRSALAIAASALAETEAVHTAPEVIGGDAGPLLDDDESVRQLEALTEAGPPVDLLTSDELAERTGISRTTVHDWLRKGRIVGWQRAKRGYLFPIDQLDDRGQPYGGIDRIVTHFPDGYAAWLWLTSTTPALSGATPLNLLRKGEVDEVEAAAIGYEQGDFM